MYVAACSWILSKDLSSSLGTWRSVWPSKDMLPQTMTVNCHGYTGGASVGFRYHPHAATGDEGCRKDEQRKVSDLHKKKNRSKS